MYSPSWGELAHQYWCYKECWLLSLLLPLQGAWLNWLQNLPCLISPRQWDTSRLLGRCFQRYLNFWNECVVFCFFFHRVLACLWDPELSLREASPLNTFIAQHMNTLYQRKVWELKCLSYAHFEALVFFTELFRQQPLGRILHMVVSRFLISILLTFAIKQLLLLI